MNDIQILAFLILPVAVAAVGWIVAFISNPPKWAVKEKPEHHILDHA